MSTTRSAEIVGDFASSERIVQAPSGPATEARVAIGHGEERGVSLEVKEIPSGTPTQPAPPAPPPAQVQSGQRVAAWVTGHRPSPTV
ncbi:MAG: hypothetical protein QM820_17580 [Minicystis sp.]